MVVAAIAAVDMAALDLDAGHALDVGDGGAEGMAVERVAVQCPGMEHELAALGLGDRGRDRDLAAELVGRTSLALSDAFDFRRVQGIDLRPALAMILGPYLASQDQQRAEARLQSGVAVDLAVDVADETPRL